MLMKIAKVSFMLVVTPVLFQLWAITTIKLAVASCLFQ